MAADRANFVLMGVVNCEVIMSELFDCVLLLSSRQLNRFPYHVVHVVVANAAK